MSYTALGPAHRWRPLDACAHVSRIQSLIVCDVFILMYQEYDYVFDIELDEGSPTMRKLKLPYDKSSKGDTYKCVQLQDDH